ncbi:LOW QUALITY PROTEIN: protein-glutamine gamma-glutamyltransferase E-like [Sceloporus undulatus]|uniref:LOW QUALITY PROTEIN: protein-glutamine gamma-glutamyltransferase E-like n=1 Tax=Sceloporus undulatus TaxID=8520 RepID=UPI001C4B2AA9|nr:LOW QUALITY PROTEIN: protein-glutamine gamma-glutamyltransferase E-like [Sceloporus undulatus]
MAGHTTQQRSGIIQRRANHPLTPKTLREVEARLTLRTSFPAKIDWKLKENGSAHYTDRYSGQELVVRRGKPFDISLTLGGAPPAASGLTFTVETGSTAALQAKTRVAFGVSGAPGGNSWRAVQTSAAASSTTLSFSISSPANAAIGRYRLGVQTGSGGSGPSSLLGTFVLLFNPWLSGDEVFMPNNVEREEYVLSESGVIFVGSAYSISSRGWDFGQFQKDILDICLSILDRSLSYRKDPTSDLRRRNDPKYVGRVLSAMINSNDDNGVIQGNWSGNYSGGESPSSWSGSGKILQKWKSSGFRPVRYGQCWVFAGVLATVLRCLGLPARVISNFNSAHDTDQSLTVDVYYDSAGNPLNMDYDSIWNFHVWNEGWFARSDLGAMYNGWQILDATPQEQSSGIFQCGPAPLIAIKEGDVDLNYDCPFVFAEVNADRVTWNMDTATGKKKKIYSETKSVGRFTSTKAVGSFDRQDVTNSYKYPEGSAKEREIFNKARAKLNLSSLDATAARLPEEAKPDVTGKFKVQSPPKVGKDVDLVLLLTNLASTARSLTANMTAWSIIYTGKAIHEVWKDSLAVTLGPKEEKAFPIKISYDEYQQHLTTDNMIRATAVCQFKEGNDAVVERDIILDNPTVNLKVPDTAKVGQVLKVEVVFANPLDQEVAECVLQVEGSDLVEGELRKEVPPVKAKQSVSVHFEVTPRKSGTKQLLTNFSCNKFQDIKAFAVIKVAK